MSDMRSVDDYIADEFERNVYLREDVLTEQGWRRWRGDWHDSQVDQLVEASSDEVKARQLYQNAVTHASTMWGRIHRFKALLVSHGLLTAEVANSYFSAPVDHVGTRRQHKSLSVPETKGA